MNNRTSQKNNNCLTIEKPSESDSPQTAGLHDYAASELMRLVGKRYSGVIRLECGRQKQDGFRISSDSRVTVISGNNPRSLLFGVYAFLKRFAGYRWFHPGEELQKKSSAVSRLPGHFDFCESPSFARRYIFPEEHFFTFSFLKSFIDWAPRNMIGDITLSFSAWEKWKKKLIPEISKRALSVTLSGHCLKMFVPKNEFNQNPEWFALIDGRRMDSGQYCYSNPSFQKNLADQLISFLSHDSLISRISIWAEDNALVCQCEDCRKKGFLKSFVECINLVSMLVRQKCHNVEIDFLAYNAGLAWEMLEPSPSACPSECGMEIAYWGRDYRYWLENSRSNPDKRAASCLEAWRKLTRGSISLLEYYTDIWMFTHLIPPIAQRIADDCKRYSKLGLDAIGSLICLAPPEIYQKKNIRDDYAPLIFPNLYFFAAMSWNANTSAKSLIADYAACRFGRNASLCLAYMNEMEKLLLKMTSYNQKLFRLRFVDIWQRDVNQSEGGVSFLPQEWTPEIQWSPDEKRRFRDCEKLVVKMQAFQKKHGWKIAEKDYDCRVRIKSLKSEWTTILRRLNALRIQLKAQQAIYANNPSAAKKYLQNAILMENDVLPAEKKICRKWLNKLKKMHLNERHGHVGIDK